MTINGQWVQDILLGIAFVGGTLLYFRSRIPQQNVKNLTILTDTYEKRIKALEDELNENHNLQLANVKAIADLQGQIKVYKDLPLRELADGIKAVNTSNQRIVDILERNATIAAADRPILAKGRRDVEINNHEKV